MTDIPQFAPIEFDGQLIANDAVHVPLQILEQRMLSW
jgi:hypothetical protein